MIRKLFGALLILSVALVILGFLLPGSVKVERTVTMQHPEHLIFDVLQDMRHFPEWAPWLVDRPQTAWRLEGPATGAGATLVWRETPQSDESRMWIVETQSPRWVGMKRSEEHTSELQSRGHLVCRLLLEKKKQNGTPPEC